MRVSVNNRFVDFVIGISEYQEETSGREGYRIIVVRDEKAIKEIIILESGLVEDRNVVVNIGNITK